MKNLSLFATVLLTAMSASTAVAQLSHNPDKFLGNITTRGSVNGGGVEFASLWNQITAENESKWASIEGSRDNFNWIGCDACYNYAKEHGFPFKFHTLVWGSQYPGWMDNLNAKTQLEEVTEWMDAIKQRYPDLPMIDVVNEAVPGHAPAPFKDALGGDSSTGYDWIIKAFEMAHERWPEAILIYNDYNTFQWQRNEFINLVKTIRDAGAPVDAYGCQSHDLTDISYSNFKSAVDQIQRELKMPMYSTEYDIGTGDDEKQRRQFKDQIPYMWEKDYFAGLTLWGYIYGSTWTTDGNSGIIRNGKDRPAMTWLREYMASDAAINAPGPYPGGVKPVSLYIKPEHPVATVGQPCDITIRANMHKGEVDHIDFYIDDKMTATLTEAPYVVPFTPEEVTSYKFKAVLYDTEGHSYERLGGLRATAERKPFLGEPISLPGIIEAEDFDICGEGVSYHDSDSKNEGDAKNYRNDAGGVDIGKGSTGYVVGYTAQGEWLEYTVDFKEDGRYLYEAIASAGLDGASFKISLINDNSSTDISKVIEVPNSGDWGNYVSLTGSLKSVKAGVQRLRITFTGSYTNLDKIRIYKTSSINDLNIDGPSVYEVYTTTGVSLGRIELNDEDEISSCLYNHTHQTGIYVLRDITTGASVKISAHP